MMAITLRSRRTAISNNNAPMPADGSVERMVIGWDHALIEHAENDVDDDQGRRNQHRRARQCILVGAGVALKARHQ